MSTFNGKGENAPFAFAKDKAVFSQAVEELRAEKADLRNPEVIEERYNEVLKGGKKDEGEETVAKEKKPKKEKK